jgi:hypothetical protein
MRDTGAAQQNGVTRHDYEILQHDHPHFITHFEEMTAAALALLE